MRLRGLVLELRPGVRRRLRHACLDDACAQPLELGDPRLGGVARSVARPSPIPGGCRIRPTVSPARRGSGHGPSGQHRPHQRDVRDAARHRPDRVERRAEREHALHRDQPPLRLEPDGLAGGGGKPDRAAGVGAERELAEAGRQRGGRAARRASGRPARVRRVAAGAVPLARAEDAPGELGQVRLADEHRARRRAGAGRRPRSAPGRAPRRVRSRRSCGCPAVSKRSLTPSVRPGERPGPRLGAARPG